MNIIRRCVNQIRFDRVFYRWLGTYGTLVGIMVLALLFYHPASSESAAPAVTPPPIVDSGIHWWSGFAGQQQADVQLYCTLGQVRDKYAPNDPALQAQMIRSQRDFENAKLGVTFVSKYMVGILPTRAEDATDLARVANADFAAAVQAGCGIKTVQPLPPSKG